MMRLKHVVLIVETLAQGDQIFGPPRALQDSASSHLRLPIAPQGHEAFRAVPQGLGEVTRALIVVNGLCASDGRDRKQRRADLYPEREFARHSLARLGKQG